MKKKVLFAAIGTILLAAVLFSMYAAQRAQASPYRDLEIERLQRGDLEVTINATGNVRGDQTAVLAWGVLGTVAEVHVQEGEQVSPDEMLAVMDQTSLPASLIMARLELINAQKELDDLLRSRTQSAQAQQAVVTARQALEDAQNPAMSQANALQAVANAEKEVESAALRLSIIQGKASDQAIEQARSNMLLAENVLKKTEDNLARARKRLKKDPENYMFFESRDLYKRIVENLEFKEINDRIRYEESVEKYNRLLEPPDPVDLAVAQADLQTAEAQLESAQREYERIQDGTSPAELAVLQAQLEDAEREAARLKDGPDPADILAVEARITAAQASLKMDHLLAPFSGTVTEVLVQEGDMVAPGTPAFRLDDLSRLVVDVQVSEVDINRIRPGQAAYLEFDSIPAQLRAQGGAGGAPADDGTGKARYTGEVVQVLSVGEEIDGVMFYQVTIVITDADSFVRPGMSVEATITVAQLEDTLLIPARAIRFTNGQRVVFVMRDGVPTPVEITTGASSDEYIQVLNGDVQAGDQLVLNPPGELVQ